MRAVLAVLAALALSCAAAPAAPPKSQGPGSGALEGTVTRVIDGDTLVITPKAGGEALQLRLADIDAPEICQPGGDAARQFLSALVLNQPVRVAGARPGPDGLRLGTLWLADVQVNRRLVEEGQAWSIRTKWDRGPFVTQERMAHALSRGLHAGGGAVPPWDFRKRQRCG